MIIDDRITAYIGSLEKEKSELLLRLEKTALEEDVPIIKKETGALLRFMIATKDPTHILEVGAAVGYSSILMSEYMSKYCNITTIEKMPDRIVRAKENIKISGKGDKITLLEGDALDILKELSSKSDQVYDFIFMDAAKGQYINFLPEIMKLLPIGGTLISDNVLQDGDIIQSRYGITRRNRTIHTRMREYLYSLTHMEQLDTIILPIGDGVTLSTRIQ